MLTEAMKPNLHHCCPHRPDQHVMESHTLLLYIINSVHIIEASSLVAMTVDESSFTCMDVGTFHQQSQHGGLQTAGWVGR